MKISINPVKTEITSTAVKLVDTVQQATKKVVEKTTKMSRPVVKPEPRHFDLYLDEVFADSVPVRMASGKTKIVPESFFDML